MESKQQEKESMQDLIEHSEQQFKAQFDPNSATYHGGSSQPVPIGGARVPHSMAQQYPDNYDPSQSGPTREQLGPEYINTESQRQIFTNLKKILAKLSPVVESIFRHDQNFKEKGDPNNEAHIKKHQEAIAKDQKDLQSVLDELTKASEEITKLGGDKELNNEIGVIIKEATIRYETKEALTEFGFKTKRVSAKTFAEAQKLLDKMKKIKKAYKPAPAAQ